MNLIDLILVRPKPFLLPEYLVEFLNSAFGRRRIYRGSAGTAQQHFNVSEFAKLDIPIPAIAEQRAVVDQLALLRAQIESARQSPPLLARLQSAVLKVLVQ